MRGHLNTCDQSVLLLSPNIPMLALDNKVSWYILHTRLDMLSNCNWSNQAQLKQTWSFYSDIVCVCVCVYYVFVCMSGCVCVFSYYVYYRLPQILSSYLPCSLVPRTIFPNIIKQVSACIYVHLVSKASNLPKMCSFSNVYFIWSQCVLVVNSNVATPVTNCIARTLTWQEYCNNMELLQGLGNLLMSQLDYEFP